MPTLRNIDIERSEKILDGVRRFAARLRKKFAIRDIYLYGSFASGEIHEGSDIDLIIVGDFTGKMPRRIIEVTRLTDLPIEPLVYTQDEFHRLRNGPFISQVLKTAKRL